MRRSLRLGARLAGALMVLFGAAHASAGQPDAPSRPALRLLAADASQLRFVGESDSHEYPVYLTAPEAGARAHLRLTYANAAAVMAEASRMKVSVNGVLLSEGAIASPAGADPQSVDIDLPAGLLEPGFNVVTVAVQQRHGVDCSLAATYELWTQLDSASSGFAFADVAEASTLDLNDLAALRPRVDGSTPIRLVIPQGVEAGRLDQLIRVAEILALRGRFTHPVVEVAAAPAGQPGLDVLLGTADDLRQSGLDAYVNEGQPSGLRPGPVPGNAVMVVSGATTADVEQAVATLMPTGLSDPPGTNAGLQALARVGGKPVSGGTIISLHDLGVVNQEFSGRLFRAGFDVLMPPDFYAADYGKLTLRVDAGYVAGLDRGGQILVRINGRDAASLALSNQHGDVFQERPITLSLADMRPGFNHVQIEALLATAADTVCDPRKAIEGKKRFILLDSSSLELPAVARIAHMPNLAVTAASGYPYSHLATEGALYLPRPDANAIAAAATVTVRSAMAAGRPLAVKLVTGRVPPAAGSAMVVAAVDDIPDTVLAAMDIDKAALREGWGHIEAQTAASQRLKAARHVGTAPDDPLTLGGGRKTSVLFHKWSDEVSAGHWQLDPGAFLADGLRRFVGISGDDLQFWNGAEPPYVPEVGSRLILAQHAAPSQDGGTWTLLVAPSGDLLERGAARLTAPSVWNQLDGRVASLGEADDAVTVTQARTGYFIATVPWRPGNMRLIAAGLLSSNLSLYVACFTGLCVILALVTLAVIRRSGVRS